MDNGLNMILEWILEMDSNLGELKRKLQGKRLYDEAKEVEALQLTGDDVASIEKRLKSMKKMNAQNKN